MEIYWVRVFRRYTATIVEGSTEATEATKTTKVFKEGIPFLDVHVLSIYRSTQREISSDLVVTAFQTNELMM